jgi:hypothetical protein
VRFERKVIEALNGVNALYATSAMSAGVVLSRAALVLSAEDLWLVVWSLHGQATGHEWCSCSVCGELRLMDPPTPKGPRERCMMSFECDGEMERIVKRPLTTARVKRSLREWGES